MPPDFLLDQIKAHHDRLVRRGGARACRIQWIANGREGCAKWVPIDRLPEVIKAVACLHGSPCLHNPRVLIRAWVGYR